MKANGKVLFDMGEKEDCMFYLEIADSDGNIFKSNDFIKDFTMKKDGMVNIVISKDNTGKWAFECR